MGGHVVGCWSNVVLTCCRWWFNGHLPPVVFLTPRVELCLPATSNYCRSFSWWFQEWSAVCSLLVRSMSYDQFLACDSMLSALYAIANPSVCLSVCPSHGWISQKQLNLGSCNFHHTVASSLCSSRHFESSWSFYLFNRHNYQELSGLGQGPHKRTSWVCCSRFYTRTSCPSYHATSGINHGKKN